MTSRPGFAELRATAGWHFFVVAFVGRLPVAMNVVGVLTLVAAARGSIAEAGIASATLGVASGLGGPVLGAAADRWGQRWVLSSVAVLNAGALAGVVVASYADVPFAVVVGACLAAGLTSPQISPLTRARWMALLVGDGGAGVGTGIAASAAAGRARLSVAMSYEGMADELSFVGGPVLVGVLATAAGPAVPVVVAAVVTVVFVIAFAWHPTAAAVRPNARLARQAHREARVDRPSLLRVRVLLPIGGMFFMGGFFGAALVSLTTFMEQRDAGAQTGLVYGCMGVTSAIFALAMVRLPERFRLAARWLAAAAVVLVAALVMPFVGTVWAMALVLLLAGAAAGPLLVTLNSVGAEAAPPRRMATTMTLLSSGITVGQALASAITGGLAQHGGFATAAIGVAVAAAAGVLLAAADIVATRRRVPRTPPPRRVDTEERRELEEGEPA
jgi:MFS family permease